MATLTKGKTFTNGELVTPQKLHELVDLGTVSGIVNADINASAAIADTKLATISTAGKVSNSATTAASTNIANAIVTRNSQGDFSANIINANLAGTANSAIKLATARTISLTGDVTGSVTFDGSANATLTAAVVDDSHNHVISNVDGLQAALDGKQPAGNYAPATGIAPSAITGTAVITTDSRLSNARTPTAHTHSAADITSGTLAIARIPTGTTSTTVALGNHTHSGYAASTHTHDDRYYTETEVNNLLAGKLGTTDTAAAATKLATAQKITLTGAVQGQGVFDGTGSPLIITTHTADPVITLTGDVTGSGTMTNLGDVTITATVADDRDILINGIIAGKGAGGNTSNTVFGSSALELNTTGYNNTAIGRRALSKNIIHDSCTAVGFDALKNSTGIYNTAVGRSSLESNTTGTLNTAIGVNALNAVTSFTNATGLGYNAQVSGSNQIRLGNSSVTAVVSQVGSWSDARDKADIRDTILGLEFIQKLRPVDYKWDFREDYRRQMPVPPPDDASLEEKAAYETEKAKWLDDVKLANISRDGTHKRTRYHHGLIAQEVQEVIAATGVDFGGFQNHAIAGGDDAMTISYIELIGPLIKAVQELAARVAALEAR